MTSDQLVPAIEIVELRKHYQRLVAIDGISLVAYRGEAFGFLGPNGAGKSTVVKILTGLVRPTSGTVRVLGESANSLETRRRIGYLPELPSFHRWLQAKEFLEFHGRLYSMRQDCLQKRIKEVLSLVGLTGREKQRLGAFSKGMLQRIGLAQALLNNPDLLILDELVTGLDPVGQRDMRDLLLHLKSGGMSIFINSHQLVDIEAICDRVAIINQGQILKIGKPESLFESAYLTFDLRVNQVSKELLHHLQSVTHSLTPATHDPTCLHIEVQNQEQIADIAAIVYECGARLYELAPQRHSLEQLFFHIIDSVQQETQEGK